MKGWFQPGQALTPRDLVGRHDLVDSEGSGWPDRGCHLFPPVYVKQPQCQVPSWLWVGPGLGGGVFSCWDLLFVSHACH